MAAAIPYAGAASIGATALGGMAQGYATSQSDKANAQIAMSNAAIAKHNATFAGEEGEQTAGVEGQKTRQTAGAEKAGMGASGVNVNTGSNADVQAGTAMTGQLDMMNIRARAARQAYGFDTQAAGFENQAVIDKSAGKNALIEGAIGGASKAGQEAILLNQSGAFDAWTKTQNNSALNGGSLDQADTNFLNSAQNSAGLPTPQY